MRQRIGMICVLLVLWGQQGCGEGAAAVTRPPRPMEPTRTVVESWAPKLSEDVLEELESRAWERGWRAELAQAAKMERRARAREGMRYVEVFEALYAARGWRAMLIDARRGYNARGDALWEVLQGAGVHDLEIYKLERLRELRGGWEVPEREGDALREPFEAEEIEALLGWMRRAGLDANSAKVRAQVLAYLAGVEGRDEAEVKALGSLPSLPGPLGERREAARAYREVLLKRSRQLAQMELWLLESGLRYARALHHGNIARDDWRDFKAAGGSLALIDGRSASFAEELAKASAGKVGSLFEELVPQHVQYGRLVELRRRLQAIEASGGFVKVSSFAPAVGVGGAKVVDLRKRLAQEGYLQEAGQGVIDAEVMSAIEAYQANHQRALDEAGRAGFWADLSITSARKLAQVELSMRRWRQESLYRGEEDFLMVNLPDFHLEYWEEGERKLRKRVVVGKANRECEDGKWRWPNRTPVQWGEMNRLVLNPVWYVPARVVKEELRPKIEESAEWGNEEGYEVYSRRGGRWKIRQKPGENNALGRVKFLFPNPHNTYLHDTRRKEYFARVVRAFSHGCMRVQDPLELARAIIKREGAALKVDEVIEGGRQKVVDLDKELPVFVEYRTVRVDAQGRGQYLTDVYREDVLSRSADPRALQRCNAQGSTGQSPSEAEDISRGDFGP